MPTSLSDFYFIVEDDNPTTNVWKTSSGSSIANNNASYLSWLTAGNTGSIFYIFSAADNGAGLIRLTLDTSYRIQTGMRFAVAGSGVADGNWAVTLIDSTHVDLQGSAFTTTFTGTLQGAQIIDTSANMQSVIASAALSSYISGTGYGVSTVSLTADTQLTNPMSTIYEVTPSASGFKLILPQMNLPTSRPIGVVVLVKNMSTTNSFLVRRFGDIAFTSLLPQQASLLHLQAITTQAGTVKFTSFVYGSGYIGLVLDIATGLPVAPNLDPDGTLAANSDGNIATQKATKTYADTKQPLDADLTTLAALGADAITPSFEGIQINGAMEVSQEIEANAVTVTAAVGAYTVDGWFAYQQGGTLVMTGQQVAPPGSPSFGTQFLQAEQLKSTTGVASPGASHLGTLQQNIEGFRWSKLAYGNSAALSVTVGFWVYATIAGTMAVSLRNNAVNRAYVVDVVINNATTWEYKTVTIPGDTTGTWLTTNGIGARLNFTFLVGSTFQQTNATWAASNTLGTSSTTNFFASNNNVVCVTGVTVLPGTLTLTAGLSPRLIRPFSTELEICRRYYRKSFPQGTAVAQNAGVAGAITVKNPIALGDPSEYVQFCPTMRASPTIVTYNPSATNANWRDITAAGDATVSVDPGSTKSMDGVLIATSGTVATLGDILAIHYTADARL